jgi:hypothetical protein
MFNWQTPSRHQYVCLTGEPHRRHQYVCLTGEPHRRHQYELVYKVRDHECQMPYRSNFAAVRLTNGKLFLL